MRFGSGGEIPGTDAPGSVSRHATVTPILWHALSEPDFARNIPRVQRWRGDPVPCCALLRSDAFCGVPQLACRSMAEAAFYLASLAHPTGWYIRIVNL